MQPERLVEPAYVVERDRVYVFAGMTADRMRERWRPAVVVVSAGNHARIAYKNDIGDVEDRWCSVEELRVPASDRRALGSAAYVEDLKVALGASSVLDSDEHHQPRPTMGSASGVSRARPTSRSSPSTR